MQNASLDAQSDYSRTAQKELTMKDDAMAIVRVSPPTLILPSPPPPPPRPSSIPKALLTSRAQVTAAQNTSVLIRDLQELWLFGSLDTLADPADDAADRAKALEIARLVEELARKPPAAHKGERQQQAQGSGAAT